MDKVTSVDADGADEDFLAKLPDRSAIADHYMVDESRLVSGLIERAHSPGDIRLKIEDLAGQLVHTARQGRRDYGGIDAFMHEYGLTSEEGIVLMCLAEALLRIPDAATADAFIAEQISGGNWESHLGQSDRLFVNASSWGLMLTGRLIQMGSSADGVPGNIFGQLLTRAGEPIIRQALRHAMRILGGQFVMGRTIKEALSNAAGYETAGYRVSYDMLGEAALTTPDAERYFERYVHAIETIGRQLPDIEHRNIDALMQRPGISVKLSALHPRFEQSQYPDVRRNLGRRLNELARLAARHNICLTIDAEEQARLDLTLQLFADTMANPALRGWPGFGIAVQAYSKRAIPTLHWLRLIAEAADRKIPIRLVKGAYWDTEIKFAQVQGLDNFPVFTRKSNTDISYLACMRLILTHHHALFPQFATHNAHTMASAHFMANSLPFEYQRLHGMGEALYRDVLNPENIGRPCRIYAPVGEHEDLLSYLVRRLLENGANTSFVHRLADDEAPISEIIRDPVGRMERLEDKEHPLIPRPSDLFRPERRNSAGIPLWENGVRVPIEHAIEAELSLTLAAGPIVNGVAHTGDHGRDILSPHDQRSLVGLCVDADETHIDQALDAAVQSQETWDRLSGRARAQILNRAADLFEKHRAGLMACMIREAGKTLDNALSEVREAVDFLRYYAVRAEAEFEDVLILPGPTGESNQLRLHGRGVFCAISPWNFPLAIFTGQVAGALAAGNAVIAKPAEQTPLTASLATTLFLEAGVPSDVLHLLPGPGETIGARLVRDPRVSGIVFTGSNQTANHIAEALVRRGGPTIPFIAETGGINAMIVDSSALPEQVVRDVVRSAFDSAGQRCSSLRVLYLQDNIFEPVIEMLKGAVAERVLGDPLDYSTDIGPVIDQQALDDLEAHKMRLRREAIEIYDPAVPDHCRSGTFVTPAIYEIKNISQLGGEIFGPILHVIRYAREDLDQICQEINSTGYGLTLGLHSRIDATADFVAERVRVGNLYVNRDQIGAMVGSQPFGGEGLSGTGPKAGGPYYLSRFATERVRSVNIAATGGNAELMALKPEHYQDELEFEPDPDSGMDPNSSAPDV